MALSVRRRRETRELVLERSSALEAAEIVASSKQLGNSRPRSFWLTERRVVVSDCVALIHTSLCQPGIMSRRHISAHVDFLISHQSGRRETLRHDGSRYCFMRRLGGVGVPSL